MLNYIILYSLMWAMSGGDVKADCYAGQFEKCMRQSSRHAKAAAIFKCLGTESIVSICPQTEMP